MLFGVRKSLSLEHWVTAFVFFGAGLVYLSLILQSALVFVIGESICLVLAPYIIWRERMRIREWWDARGKCTECGFDLRGIKGKCPGCGHKRIVE